MIVARPLPRWPLALAAACLLGGCAQDIPGKTPPGVDPGSTPQLFFPLGLGLDPAGTKLYVANSNFDRAFSTGTLVELPTALFDQAAAAPDKLLATLPATLALGRLDSFSGELQVSPDGTTVFVTSRENDLLNAAPLEGGSATASGTLNCGAQRNCSADAVQLGASGDNLKMFDPFALRVASIPVPGQAAPQPMVVVTHQSPPLTNDPDAGKAWLALIPQDVARASKKPFQNGAVRVQIGSFASSSLAVDPATGRTFVGGCFQRVSGESVVACVVNTDVLLSRQNPLRSLLPAAFLSNAASPVEQTNLGSFLGGGNTEDVAVSADGRTLYVANSTPNALLVLDTPPLDGGQPTLRRLIPLASAPTKLRVLSRAGGDIVVASSLRTNSLLVIDPVAGGVLSQLDLGAGTGAFGLATHPTATGDRVYVGLFNACGVAAVDVPAAEPAAAQLVGIVGRCP